MFLFEHHGLEKQEFFKQVTLTNQNFPLHFHRAFEIIFVVEGNASIIIENNQFLIEKSSCIFIFPNQMHALELSDTAILDIIIFSPELIGYFYNEYKSFHPDNPVLRKKSLLPSQNLSSVYAQKSFLYHLADELVSSSSFSKVSYTSDIKLVQKIFAYVEKNYQHNITLKNISLSLKYDYAYLSKIFKEVTQLTFTEYLNEYRISQASYFLKNTEEDVLEIAFDCGYQNIRTFNRNFKKINKLTPMEYRNNYFN